jgi:hypothetical protein
MEQNPHCAIKEQGVIASTAKQSVFLQEIASSLTLLAMTVLPLNLTPLLQGERVREMRPISQPR